MRNLMSIGNPGCDGKKAFDTYQQASRSAKLVNRRDESARMNVYRCKSCKYWHVGNYSGIIKHKRLNRHNAKEYDEGIRVSIKSHPVFEG